MVDEFLLFLSLFRNIKYKKSIYQGYKKPFVPSNDRQVFLLGIEMAKKQKYFNKISHSCVFRTKLMHCIYTYTKLPLKIEQCQINIRILSIMRFDLIIVLSLCVFYEIVTHWPLTKYIHHMIRVVCIHVWNTLSLISNEEAKTCLLSTFNYGTIYCHYLYFSLFSIIFSFYLSLIHFHSSLLPQFGLLGRSRSFVCHWCHHLI